MKITAQDAFDKKLGEQPGHVISLTSIDTTGEDFIPLYPIEEPELDDYEDDSFDAVQGKLMVIPRTSGYDTDTIEHDSEVFVYVDYRAFVELEARFEDLVRYAYNTYKTAMYGEGYERNEWMTRSEFFKEYGLEIADDD